MIGSDKKAYEAFIGNLASDLAALEDLDIHQYDTIRSHIRSTNLGDRTRERIAGYHTRAEGRS